MSSNRSTRNSVVYIGVAAVQRGAPFLLLLALAIFVPVESFGQFAVLASIYGLLTSAATFGMESVAFRGFFIHSLDSRNCFYSTLAKLTFVGPLALGALIATALSVSAEKPLNVPVEDIVMTVLGGCLFAAGSTIPLALLRAEERVTRYVGVVLPPAILMAGIKFILCGVFSYGALGWAIGDLIGGLVMLVIALPYQYRFVFSWQTSWSDLRESLRIGLPLLPHVLSGWTLNLSDRLLIAGLLGAAAAGEFAFAAQIAMVITVLSVEINRGVLPVYGRAAQDAGCKRLRHVVEIQRTLAFALGSVVAVAGTTAVAFLAPTDYRESAQWIPVLALASCCYCLYLIPMNYLSVIAGRTTRMALITTSTAAVNVVINILLLPALGIGVAAYSTFISYLALAVLTTAYAGNYAGIAWTGRSKSISALLAAAMLAMVWIATLIT